MAGHSACVTVSLFLNFATLSRISAGEKVFNGPTEDFRSAMSRRLGLLHERVFRVSRTAVGEEQKRAAPTKCCQRPAKTAA
jgi:hypothetical protein